METQEINPTMKNEQMEEIDISDTLEVMFLTWLGVDLLVYRILMINLLGSTHSDPF